MANEVFVICISLLLAIGAFSSSQYLLQVDSEFLRIQRNFYSQEFPHDSIFILGSSHVFAINSSVIEDVLNGSVVYNLAVGGDKPVKRIQSISQIIAAHPSVVVYGVGLRDFQPLRIVGQSAFEAPISLLPTPRGYVADIFAWMQVRSFGILESPKFVTLSFNAGREQLQRTNSFSHPFLGNLDHSEIRGLEELQSLHQPSFEDVRMENVAAMQEIVQRLRSAGIEVIVFGTPHHFVYSDLIPAQVNEDYQRILEELGAVDLSDRYSQLNVWHDLEHLTDGRDGRIYSEDIARLIRGEDLPAIQLN